MDGLKRKKILYLITKSNWGEKRIRGASQDLEQFLRKVYRICKMAHADSVAHNVLNTVYGN